MMKITLSKLATALTLVVPAVMLTAETALAANNYVAIAYSKSTGASGSSRNYASRTAASRAALRACERSSGAGDCRTLVTGLNTCVALARASNRAYGWARNNSNLQAQVNALVECSKNGRYCTIRHSVCAGR